MTTDIPVKEADADEELEKDDVGDNIFEDMINGVRQRRNGSWR